MRLTHLATYSLSSRWLSASLRGSGARKYLHMIGSSVTVGSLRVCISDEYAISKCRKMYSSVVLRAALSSKNRWNA